MELTINTIKRMSGIFSGTSENKIRYVYGFERKAIELLLAASMLKRTYTHLRDNSRSFIDAVNFFDSQITLASISKYNKYVNFNGSIYIDCFAPKWPGKAFNRIRDILFQNIGKEQDKWSPFIPYLVFSITRKCVYRCEHCYAIHSLGNKDVLSFDKILQVAKDFQKIGVGVIAWEGGEPLIRFDELITLIERTCNESEAWLATTAYGLNNEKARRLKEAGLTAAIISLDHYEPDKHNAFRRNKKSFDIAINGIHIFRENGILPSVAICATKETAEQEELFRYLELAKKIGVAFVQIIDAMPSGRYIGENVILSKSQIDGIKKFQILINTDPRFRDYPGISARPLFEDDDCFGCGACNGTCYIDSSGNVQPCVMLQITFGNVLEEGVEDIYKRMKGYFPHFVGGRCPAQAYSKSIAKEYNKTKVLPLSYDSCIDMLNKIGKRELPKKFQSIREKQKRNKVLDFIYSK